MLDDSNVKLREQRAAAGRSELQFQVEGAGDGVVAVRVGGPETERSGVFTGEEIRARREPSPAAPDDDASLEGPPEHDQGVGQNTRWQVFA
jgi:hypothetical protein